MDNVVAANVLGVTGAVCWSVQLIPQIVINYRKHDTTGLQPTMMMLWAWAGVPLGVYNIVSNFNIALRIQPQILTLLSLTTWIQCQYYERKWSLVRALAVVVPIAFVMAGIEVALVYALRIGLTRGVEWPATLMAVLAALFLALGVLRHYVDILQTRTVRGISFLFVGIDALGDLTSLLSVLFERNLDILGVVIYGVELLLWLGVFACGGYFNLIPWLKNRNSLGRVAPHGDAQGREQSTHTVGSVVSRDLPCSSSSVFRTASMDGIRARRIDPGGEESISLQDRS